MVPKPDALLIPERDEWMTECPVCAIVLLGDTPDEAEKAWHTHNEETHRMNKAPGSDLFGEKLLSRLATPSSREWRWAVDAVGEYFKTDSYTGGNFERFGDSDANRITATDLVAVSMLGVDVPATAAIEILQHEADAIRALLKDVPTKPMHRVKWAEIGPDSAAEKLWNLVRSSKGLGRTKTSKILARKRPHLIPVWDSRIEYRLPQLGGAQWERSWDWWQDAEHVSGIKSLRNEVSGIGDISLLRVLDVAVWRYDVALRPTLRRLSQP